MYHMRKNVFITLGDNILETHKYISVIYIYIKCMYRMWKNVFIILEDNIYLYWRHINIHYM